MYQMELFCQICKKSSKIFFSVKFFYYIYTVIIIKTIKTMSKFKLPKKFNKNNQNNNVGKTINLFTFDDTVFGSEIKDEWEYSMLDAMCYCQNREMGYSIEACHQVILDYREQMDNVELW